MSPDAPVSEGAVVLVDGSAFAYRAHTAMERQGLSRKDGLPTGAIFAFSNDLKRFAETAKPKALVVVFDAPGRTFRDDIYSEYKATRPPMPEELVRQWPWIKRAAEVLGAVVLERAGVEADDVVGALARRASAEGETVVVLSPDKDLLQLVDERVVVVRPPRTASGPWTTCDVAKVEELWGVPPKRVADVLALMGDAVDNAPGVPGVGEITAKKLVAAHGDVEDVLAQGPKTASPKIAKALVEHADRARLTKRLVVIKTDIDDLPSTASLRYEGPRREEAEEFFRSMEFRTLSEAFAPPRRAAARDYRLVATEEELDRLVATLEAADMVAVDTETTSIKPLEAALVCLSFAVEDGEAWCVPLRADPPLVKDEADAPFRGAAVVERLRPFLENERRTKCGQNAKYDVLVLRRHGVRLSGLRCDTMLASYLLEPGKREHNLDALALDRFGVRKIKTEELLGKGKDALTMDLIPIDAVSEYACEDADYTRRLAVVFEKELEDNGLKKLHDDVELPLLFVLCDMEETGVRVDRDLLKKLASEWTAAAEKLAEEIRDLAGDPTFNPGSPKKLGELLFDELKVHEGTSYKPKRTKIGYATGQEELEELGSVATVPLVEKVLAWRSMSKLVSTYVAPLPSLATEAGRLHTSFNQAVAATGRLSSSDPNLQNIPIRTEEGRKIRRAFLPSDEKGALISADYSQIELRLLAHFSNDEALVGAFRDGRDIHRETAARVFDVAPDKVDAAARARAKAINFGVLYGMGPQRLARETGMTLDEAKAFIERYFAAFPKVRGFLEGLVASARERGYAETILGRRRPIPDLDSPNGMLRSQARNMAVNTPIQGSAADVIKLAMIETSRAFSKKGFRSRLVLQVHDELVVDAARGEVDDALKTTVDAMEGVASLSVPLKVDAGFGKDWLEAH
jgi:DNA polymerase I